VNDLEERIDDLLHRVADGVRIHPDVDAVLVGAPATRVDRSRHLVVVGMLVAAALVAIALVGMFRGDRPDPVVTAPAEGLVFPVLDELPFDGYVTAVPIKPETLARDGQRVVLGHRNGNGAINKLAVVSTSSSDPGIEGEEVEVGPLGLRAEKAVAGHATTLAFRTSPRLVVTGNDPYTLVGSTTPVSTRESEHGGAELLLGTLPEGYETVVPLGPVPARRWTPYAAVAVDSREDRFEVATYADHPLAVLASLGVDAQPMEVAGHRGWGGVLQESNVVAWSVGEGRTIVVASTLTPAQVLSAATHVRLVDGRTFGDRYHVDPSASTTTAVTAQR
jgi:hypothetical protein